MEEKLLVVVCLLQGRNFPKRAGHSLVVEARFNGELLETDPAPHNSGVVELNTELAWEMTRKDFQQHKLQRTPIKLQCFAVDNATTARQLAGYVLLDLRTAQQTPEQQWHNVLNSCYSRLRPELNVSLAVETQQQQQQQRRQQRHKPHPQPAPPTLSLTLDPSGGYYQLGAADTSSSVAKQHIYTLSIMLQNAQFNTEVLSGEGSWYFYYNLLGNDITSEMFTPPTFPPERASIRIRSTRELLGLLLAAQENVKLQLCCADSSVCGGSFSLGALAASDALHTSVQLTTTTPPALAAGQPASPPPPPPCSLQLLARVELEPPPSSSSSTSLPPPSSSSFPDPPTSAAAAAAFSSAPSPSRAAKKVNATSPKIFAGAKRNLTQSFEEVSHDSPSVSHDHTSSSSSLLDNDAKSSTLAKKTTPTKSLPKSPASRVPAEPPTVTPSPPHTSTHPHTSTPSSPHHNQPEPKLKTQLPQSPAKYGKTSPLKQPTNTGHTNKHKTSPAHRLSDHTHNHNSGPASKTAQTSAATRHFKFSVDLHTIENLHMGGGLSCYLRYSYPFFGSSRPVVVQPAVTVAENSQQRFAQSFCAFEFATTEDQLTAHVTSRPLTVEVWRSCDQSSDTLVGVANVPLREVLSCQKVLVERCTERRICSLRVPISPPALLGYLHTVLVLEDMGLATPSLPLSPHHPHTEPTSGLPLSNHHPHTEPTSGLPLSNHHPHHPHHPPQPHNTAEVGVAPEYRAALELELWKMAEEEAFQKHMSEREAAHMTRLAGEWQKREQHRQLLLKQKVEHYSQLELQLQEAMRGVRRQQEELGAAEAKTTRERERLEQERQALQSEVQLAVQQAETTCQHKVEIERLRSEELSSHVDRLKRQLADLEIKLRNRDQEFESYRQQLLSQPESKLQAELSIAQLEKVELERKLSAAVKSKLHYKEQWSKALKELAAARQREQSAAREQLKQQQQELELMRERYLQQEEQRNIHTQLMDVKSEMDRLQEHALSQKSAAPPPPTAPPPTLPPPPSRNQQVDANVARWIEERDILLQTGVYTSADLTIQKLDQKIREALSQKAQE